VEVVVAVAILAVIGVAFLSGMTTAFKSNILADSKTNAAAIAQSQLEDLKTQDYIAAADEDVSVYSAITDVTDGFYVYSLNREGTAISGVIGIPVDTEDGSYVDVDKGIQVIHLVIKQDNKEVYSLDTYKVRQ